MERRVSSAHTGACAALITPSSSLEHAEAREVLERAVGRPRQCRLLGDAVVDLPEHSHSFNANSSPIALAAARRALTSRRQIISYQAWP
jgi:hypothetical protein